MRNIIRTKDIAFGRPRLNGTRLEVFNIISDVKNSTSFYQYLEEREITKEEVIEAKDYCQSLKCQKIENDFEKYCSNCLLSTLHEQYNYRKNFEKIDDGVFKDTEDGTIYLGTLEELKDQEFGYPGWVLAGSIVLPTAD
jgi:uncharacterized protein (DUF433 family)